MKVINLPKQVTRTGAPQTIRLHLDFYEKSVLKLLDYKSLKVYIALVKYSDNHTRECYPSIRCLSGEIGLSTGSVSNAMKILRNLNLIEFVRFRERGSKVYRITSSRSWRS